MRSDRNKTNEQLTLDQYLKGIQVWNNYFAYSNPDSDSDSDSERRSPREDLGLLLEMSNPGLFILDRHKNVAKEFIENAKAFREKDQIGTSAKINKIISIIDTQIPKMKLNEGKNIVKDEFNLQLKEVDQCIKNVLELKACGLVTDTYKHLLKEAINGQDKEDARKKNKCVNC